MNMRQLDVSSSPDHNNGKCIIIRLFLEPSRECLHFTWPSVTGNTIRIFLCMRYAVWVTVGVGECDSGLMQKTPNKIMCLREFESRTSDWAPIVFITHSQPDDDGCNPGREGE